MAASDCRTTNAGLLLAAFLSFTSNFGAAQETNSSPLASGTVITNMAQFWAVVSDPVAKSQLHHAQIKFLVYYCDTNWNVAWGKSDEVEGFLPLRHMNRGLKFGDEALIDGWVLPMSQEFLWDRTSVTVLSESNQIDAVSARQRLLEADAMKSRFVEVEALVESVRTITPVTAKLSLLADNVNLDGFVHVDEPVTAWPDWVGKIVRLRGVYSPTIDPFGKISNIILWTPGLNNVEIIGALADDPRFSIPVVASENFPARGSGTAIRVRGQVRSQEPGEAVTIWDATGQILILSKQRQALQVGQRIEAIGYPAFQGMDRVLQMGLFRTTTNKEAGDFDVITNAVKLRLADQVRGLDQESIALHPKVNLQGVITYVDDLTNFIFVQDSSGGIRVTGFNPGRRGFRPGMLVTVHGEVTLGDFAPIITNAVVRQAGYIELSDSDAPIISLEDALSGTEDGHRIQMRGYVRRARVWSRTVELQLVAPAGEFVARVPRDDAPEAPQGSIVLVKGVCVAMANSKRQLTGIELWSASPGSVQTEQSAPDDVFAQPLRSIASLRQFNLFNTLNKRVHTAGTVTLQVPGRCLYLQDGDTSLFALSSQTELLHLGDRVEVVGFADNSGGNFLLREAVYRPGSPGPELKPMKLSQVQSADEDLDGLLVQMNGLLLDAAKNPDETRLLIQDQGRIFEAKLDETLLTEGTGADQSLEPGSKITVTGVYRIKRDESGRPLSFLLNLRSQDDIQVLAPPPWWTPRRLLILLCGGLPLLLLVLFWTLQTRRKNQLLQRAQGELQAARDRLEERVEERTRELNEESEARKRALVRLSEAQQRLLLASRQAGMAEVATGILHNVGNILNSVNVSATLVNDCLQRLRIPKFLKAVDLLSEHAGNLGAFLAEDPRGRALPGYLHQLAGNMAQNEQTMRTELKTLNKQIDHVKSVIAWQQTHARNTGFYETLNAEELMEDALQINRGSYERHGIKVVRQYERIPPLMADRHKIIQILINILSNARHALTASSAPDKRVTVRICPHGADRVRFEISDNGVGISPENMGRIFSLGFTTKLNGHGFGLHSGANSAKEMGGNLFATSEGLGRGATFVLELPLVPKSARGTTPRSEPAVEAAAA